MHKRAGHAALKAVAFATSLPEMLRSKEETMRREATLARINSLPAVAAPAYLMAGVLYTLAHPTLLAKVALYAAMASAVALAGTLGVWVGALYPQAMALEKHMAAALAWIVSVVLCIAYTALVGLLTYAIFMPCCEDMLIETTFRLRNQAMPSSGTLKPLVHNIQATIVVIVWAFITLPINFIPVVGQIAWVVLNGLPSGWESHADYFSRKGLGFYHQRRAIWAHKWEYWTFGMGKLCMFMVPFVNILFMFTIVVSAALWAVDYEKKLEQRGGSESDIASQPRSYDSMATSAL